MRFQRGVKLMSTFTALPRGPIARRSRLLCSRRRLPRERNVVVGVFIVFSPRAIAIGTRPSGRTCTRPSGLCTCTPLAVGPSAARRPALGQRHVVVRVAHLRSSSLCPKRHTPRTFQSSLSTQLVA